MDESVKLQIIDLYTNEHKTSTEIAKIVNLSFSTVCKVIRDNDIPKQKFPSKLKKTFTPEEISDIIYIYTNVWGCMDIIKAKYNITPGTVNRILRENGCAVRSEGMPRKYKVNDNFFESIDSRDKAYILGYIITDGYVSESRGRLVIGLSLNDKEILDRISRSMESTYPIRIRKQYLNNKEFLSARLEITSQKIISDLVKLGIRQCKSSSVKIPCIPVEYYPDLLRGLFDGDGTITNRGTFNFCGNQFVVGWVKSYCETIIDREYQMSTGAYHKEWFKIYRITNKKHSKVIFDVIYSNAPQLYLTRKFERFKSLYGN